MLYNALSRRYNLKLKTYNSEIASLLAIDEKGSVFADADDNLVNGFLI